jgi:choline dehydrogenase-like flavoprotein
MEYTFEEYRSFLESFLDAGYEFCGFTDLPDRAVVVRHDVDLSAASALEMARVEADVGVQTTYCFLLTSPAYDVPEHVEALETIQSLGHDVALHFDPHFYWDRRPGTDALASRVGSESTTLERLVGTSVDTVSFHMPPEWALGTTFESFENAYQPRFFGEIEYVSDSRQKWRAEPVFDGERPEQVQILVHPGLWTAGGRPMAEIVTELVEDQYERIDRYVDRYVEAA